jgi:type IV secretory pathway component VirB8
MKVSSYFAFQKFFNHENTGSFAKQYLHHYQTEVDTIETIHDFSYKLAGVLIETEIFL